MTHTIKIIIIVWVSCGKYNSYIILLLLVKVVSAISTGLYWALQEGRASYNIREFLKKTYIIGTVPAAAHGMRNETETHDYLP